MDVQDVVSFDKIIQIVNEAIEVIFVPAYLLTGVEATGDFRRSLNAKQSSESSVSVYGAGYAPYVQDGTGPNDPQPSVQELIRWAMAKFNMDYGSAESMAYGLKVKIRKFGTDGYQEGGREVFEILESPEFLNFIREKLGHEIRLNMSLFIKLQLRKS